MIRVILLLSLLAAVLYAIGYLRRQPPVTQRKLIARYALYFFALVLIGLALTGRLHWLGAVIAALLPFIQRLLQVALKAWPLLRFWKKRRTSKQAESEPPKATTGELSREQACAILGLSGNPSAAEVSDAHRKLMQKLHPDRGGSDYLAAQINQAKDTLLS